MFESSWFGSVCGGERGLRTVDELAILCQHRVCLVADAASARVDLAIATPDHFLGSTQCRGLEKGQGEDSGHLLDFDLAKLGAFGMSFEHVFGGL